MFMETAKQAIAPIDVVNFGNTTANFNSAIGIDMSKFKRALFVLQIGVMNTAATLDARLQSSAYSSLNTVVNITGTNIAQIAAASNSNTIVLMEVRADQVAQQNAGHRYVRLNCTVGGSSINAGVIGYGLDPVQKPADQYVNTSIVTQEVVGSS